VLDCAIAGGRLVPDGRLISGVPMTWRTGGPLPWAWPRAAAVTCWNCLPGE
jgi:hypothetical protein